MDPLLFDGWDPVGRTAIIGVLGYLGLIVLLRVSGKRTLSKLNMFDFIVTVAFGSVLAGMMMSKTSTLAQGLTAFAVLVILQFCFTTLAVRWPFFDSAIKAEPRLLYYDNRFFEKALQEERVTKTELHAAIRDSGVGDISLVHSIVLETNGQLSVIAASKLGSGASLPQEKKAASRP